MLGNLNPMLRKKFLLVPGFLGDVIEGLKQEEKRVKIVKRKEHTQRQKKKKAGREK